MDRRDFLVRGAAGAGAVALTRCGGASPGAATAPAGAAAAAGSWEAVRDEFALARDRVHMTGFLLASHPRVVREAIERHQRAFDEDPATYFEESWGRHEREVRAAATEYLGAGVDEVAMTDSTTMGLGVVYGGLDLRPGQEILTTTHDHIVTHVSLELRGARAGVVPRKVALYDRPESASADEMASRLAKAITPATRVVALTWVHSGTGVKLPIRAMAEVVARANAGRAEADRALLFVDGVHGFGNQPEAAATLGADFFIAGCHKWIFGPRGTGLVWARKDAWPATSPAIVSFDPGWRTEPLDQMPAAALMTPGGFHSFEYRWALAQAFEMHRALGRERVAARVTELNTRCKQGLKQLRKVRLRTPLAPELSAGIICFEVDGMAPAQVVEQLHAQRIIASVTPPFYEPTYARLAPSLLTLEADVDRAVAAVAAL
jgi:isopenicillin-N epimerase